MPPPARPRLGAVPVVLLALALPLLLAAGGTAGAAQPATPTTTVEAAPRTVGELDNRIVAAWTGVRSYRTSTVIAVMPEAATPGATASPLPPEAVSTFVDEVLRPARLRRTSRVGNRVVGEAIAVRGRLWVRDLVDDPAAGLTVVPWREIDLASLDPESASGIAFAALAAPPRTPFADLPLPTRLLPLEPLGPVIVAGRACHRFRITAPGDDLEEVVVAIGADDLPCASETRFRTVLTWITYDAYNLPLTIDPPPDFVPATPDRAGG